ncbi:hypothetical protein PR202_ga08997 [Eleusine coracana subsp. coracana]|uniref:Uncharacterized protein n=1 Tax=Eleusine coracana subsp. coracana TaxID=191504 RepID=A0AAV5C1Q8_ELECO|nr:hypothetical protein QOZ80_1AG0040350 [Eleusine coracana subsp. coracana]GJM92520.1 hypothetical protein PR202_ga08997 [Eleusine coracana subsp. coracana]
MGIQVAAVAPPPCSSSASPASSSAVATSPRPAVLGVRLARSQSSLASGLGRGARHATISRALSASIDSVGDDEEFLKRIQELAAGQHQPGGCGWPASVERSASSVELPLSLRMLKRRKQQLELERAGPGLMDRAGESARAAVGRAFSSMVLMIRELQSFTLQMRETLLYEDLQAVLSRVHAEMHASFVWLFQHIFSGTPALMVSLMLLLANFTVYSMGASAVTLPPPHPHQAAVVEMVHTQQPEQESSQRLFDAAELKTFSIGSRTASVGGNSGGGGKVRPVAGAMGDGHSDESEASSYRQSGTVSPQAPMGGGNSEASVSSSDSSMAVEDELVVWKRISDEATRMQASARAEELMDPDECFPSHKTHTKTKGKSFTPFHSHVSSRHVRLGDDGPATRQHHPTTVQVKLKLVHYALLESRVCLASFPSSWLLVLGQEPEQRRGIRGSQFSPGTAATRGCDRARGSTDSASRVVR